jgi:hypothetical protein
MIIRGEWVTKRVWLDGKLLSYVESQKVRNHSPDGFNWGYGGSGAAQLALAVCLKVMPRREALHRYQDFKFKAIANLPQSDFEVDILKGAM